MRFLIIITVFGMLVSCRSTRKIQTAINKKDTVVAEPNSGKLDSMMHFMKATMKRVDSNRILWNTFNAKVNVDYRGVDDKHYDVNASVRMLKDSAIWISVNAVLGIEAMRVYITRDSVKLMDKLNKTYTARSISYLQEVTDLPLDLYTLQDLIIGNPIFVDSNTVSYSKDANTISILSIGMWFKNLLTIQASDNAIVRIKLDDVDVSRNRTADITYSDYETRKGPLFPTKRNIIISEKGKLQIKMDFKNYDFNEEVSFPFTVSKNYDRL